MTLMVRVRVVRRVMIGKCIVDGFRALILRASRWLCKMNGKLDEMMELILPRLHSRGADFF